MPLENLVKVLIDVPEQDLVIHSKDGIKKLSIEGKTLTVYNLRETGLGYLHPETLAEYTGEGRLEMALEGVEHMKCTELDGSIKNLTHVRLGISVVYGDMNQKLKKAIGAILPESLFNPGLPGYELTLPSSITTIKA